MYLTLVIGHTGQGKSTLVRKAIEGKKCFVFDVNNEYPDLQFERADEQCAGSSKFYGDFETFLNKCELKRNCDIVFEEATGFLKGQVGKKTTRLIIGKRHQKNNYYFLFHSINSVPPAIFDLCNYVILFKTMDEPRNIKGGLKMLAPYCNDLKKKPQYSKHVIKTI